MEYDDSRISDHIDDPRKLENLYRHDPISFKKAFNSAREKYPDSLVLAVWQERLFYQEPVNAVGVTPLKRDFIFMGICAMLAGISSRIMLYFIEMETISPVNLVFGILPFIAAYFVYRSVPRKNILYTLLSLFLISVIYMNLLPLEERDSIIMAYLHLPIFLGALLGLAFTGNDYRLGSARLAYLKFIGEFCILYACMAISGMLLAALTLQLFNIVGMDIEEFYFSNVVLFGAAALAVVSAYLVAGNLKLTKAIAPYIAKIFSPLVLVTLLAYLAAVVWAGKNPFLDRNFLIVFNGILLCVLAVTIYSITESGSEEKKSLSDLVNFALIVLALVIDSVALSSIIFRLSSYGITPNRIAVLGVNILIFAHLIWIMLAYAGFLRHKRDLTAVQDRVTRYLPFYGLWAALVTFTFPLIFK